MLLRCIQLVAVWLFVGVGTAYTEGLVLSDVQMDLVTAGSTEAAAGNIGSAIVGTDGKLTLGLTNAVAIRDYAQQGVQALNLVNSHEGMTANAMNVWVASPFEGTASGSADTAVQQVNGVSQRLSVSSRLGSQAELGQAILFGPIIDEAEITSRLSQGTAAIDGRIRLFGDRTTTTRSDDESSTSRGTFAVDVQAGTGIALAGTGEFDVNAGSFTIDWLNTASTTTTEQVTILGIPVKNDKTTLTVKEELHQTIELGGLHGRVTDGFLCMVAIGNCVGGGVTHTTATKVRREIMPTTISNAEGQYIVMSGGELAADAMDVVSLSGAAQQGTAAVNLVNAAASAVANSVNVARTGLTPGVGAASLRQHNLFTQAR